MPVLGDECVCKNMFPLRTKWKQEGKKGEKKRKEALGGERRLVR